MPPRMQKTQDAFELTSDDHQEFWSVRGSARSETDRLLPGAILSHILTNVSYADLATFVHSVVSGPHNVKSLRNKLVARIHQG